MQPLTAEGAGVFCRRGDQPGPDAAALQPGADDRVQDERVGAAVPDDIDEPDEFAVQPRAYPAQADRVDAAAPVDVVKVMPERFSMQGIEGIIVEVAAPFIGSCHATIIRTA